MPVRVGQVGQRLLPETLLSSEAPGVPARVSCSFEERGVVVGAEGCAKGIRTPPKAQKRARVPFENAPSDRDYTLHILYDVIDIRFWISAISGCEQVVKEAVFDWPATAGRGFIHRRGFVVAAPVSGAWAGPKCPPQSEAVGRHVRHGRGLQVMRGLRPDPWLPCLDVLESKRDWSPCPEGRRARQEIDCFTGRRVSRWRTRGGGTCTCRRRVRSRLAH